MLAIVVPQAFTDGVDVVKPVILAHAKGHPDVGQRLSRNQIMECASKDDNNFCVDSTQTGWSEGVTERGREAVSHVQRIRAGHHRRLCIEGWMSWPERSATLF